MAEPIEVLLSKTVMVLPASPTPLRVGVVSLVDPPSDTGLLLSAVIEGALGVFGAVASTSKSTGLLGKLVLPAKSVSVIVKLWSPSPNGVGGVNVHFPSGATVAVPMLVAPSKTVMVLPASPVPLRVGVVSFVNPFANIGLALLSTIASTFGVLGGVVSTSIAVELLGSLVLPATSVSVVVRL